MARQLYELVGADVGRNFSPYVWRIRLALAHKQLAYERVPVRFTDKPLLAFSGQGLVPVLVDDETVVCDSWRIAEYLDAKYPHPLYATEAEKAAGLFIKCWCERVLQPLLLRILAPDIYRHLHTDDQNYFRETREQRLGVSFDQLVRDREAYLAELAKVLLPLQDSLQQQKFFGGSRANFTDYLVFAAFQWARCISPIAVVDRDTPLYTWRETLLQSFDGLAADAPGYAV